MVILAAIFLPGMCSGEGGTQTSKDDAKAEQRDSTQEDDSTPTDRGKAKIKTAELFCDSLKGLDFCFEDFLPEVEGFIQSLDQEKDNAEVFRTLQQQYEVMKAIADELAKAHSSNVTKDNLKNDIPATLQTYLNEGDGLTDEQSNILHTLINEKPKGYKDTYLVNYYRDPMNSFRDIQAIVQKKPVQEKNETPAPKKKKSKGQSGNNKVNPFN